MLKGNFSFILLISVMLFHNALCQDTLGVERRNSFYDFSLSTGKSGYSIYFSKSSPEYARKFTDYGVSFRLGSKWKIKEYSSIFDLGLQCNWFRIKGSYCYGTGEYLGTGWGVDTIHKIQFDAPILNVGIVNQFNIGKSFLQLNFNTGPSVFYYSKIGVGWVFNPEIKLGYRKLYISWDYSLISILHHYDRHVSVYRKYSCFSIGRNF